MKLTTSRFRLVKCKRGDGGVRLLIDEDNYDKDEWVKR